jgi:LemA protein
MNVLYFFGGIIVLLALYIWSLYNGLVTLKMHIDEAWSQIDVQLKRRADLIPNLVETVKGYAKHEKSIMTAVTDAHKAMLGAKTVDSKAKASDALSGALGKLLAIAENYPQLKANDSFIQLQKELSDTEDKVAYSRQYYNSSVLEFNTKIKIFPNSLLASGLGFNGKEFFGASEADRQPTKVKFE